MSDEVLVDNLLSKHGMRFVSVMRMGQDVQIQPWVERFVSWEAHGDLNVMRRTDEAGMHHLHMWWKAREVVELVDKTLNPTLTPALSLTGRGGSAKTAVMWNIRKNEETGEEATIRSAADWAADLLKLRTGRAAEQVVVSKIPAGAPEEFALETSGIMVRLVAEDWVPVGFVMVM